MSIDERLLNITMLRGCKYRVTQGANRNEVRVPIYIPLRFSVHQRGDMADAREMAQQEIVISKACAQAYINLYLRVTEMQKELESIQALCRSVDTVSIHEIPKVVGRIGSLAWGLDERIRRFLEDEHEADRKDIDV